MIRGTASLLVQALAAGGLLLAAAGVRAAERDCPWVVQPYVSEAVMSAGRPAWDIVYDGLKRRRFYAFTVRSRELAERLRSGRGLPRLEGAADPLETVTTPLDSEVYRMAPTAMWPATIYLVASETPVADLERLGATIRPSRPIAASEYVPRFRGGSDWSGALPPPALEATVLVTPDLATNRDLTVCAYDLAGR